MGENQTRLVTEIKDEPQKDQFEYNGYHCRAHSLNRGHIAPKRAKIDFLLGHRTQILHGVGA